MQHYRSKYLAMIALCMACYTTANASAESLKLKKPKYWPTTLYTLGITGRIQIPNQAITAHDYIELEKIYVMPSLNGQLPLIEFRKSFLNAGLTIGYSYIETAIPTDRINLTEHHVQICPSMGFTLLANSYFYVLSSVWIGYEIDAIVGSALTENGTIDKQWPFFASRESIALGFESKYFYGVYFGYSASIPLQAQTKTTETIEAPNRKSQFTKSGSWKNKFARESRDLASPMITFCLGYDLLSIWYPPSTTKKADDAANSSKAAAVYEEEI